MPPTTKPRAALPGNDPVSWVESCLQTRTQDGAQVARFKIEVRQSGRERNWSPHATIHAPRTAGPETAAEIVTQICSEIDNSEFRQARVVALMPSTKIPVSSRPWETPFTEDGEIDDGGLNGQDPATAIVSQCMRHNEVLLMRMQLMADAQMKTLAAQNELLLSQQTALLKERLELANTMRDVLLDKAELETKATRDNTLAESASTLVQAFACMLTNGKVSGDSRLENLERILKSIGGTITEEQATGLAGVLTPPQLVALSAVTQDPIAKADELEQARKKDQARKNKTPDDNVE